MAEGTVKAMQGFLDCYEGSKLKGSLVATGVYEKGAIKETKFLDKAEAGCAIVMDTKTGWILAVASSGATNDVLLLTRAQVSVISRHPNS